MTIKHQMLTKQQVSEGEMQMETHKIDELTENMFNNVNHLIECQRFVMERVEFLEAKRVEITNMIQNISSSSYKETLEIQINKIK